jgi:hypothetical protein
MKVGDISNWYRLTRSDKSDYNNIQSKISSQEFELIADRNGFIQLYYNKKRMGTVINKRFVLVKSENMRYLDEILPYLFGKLSIEAVCINSRTEINLPLLDQCLLFRAPFSKITKTLNIS